MYYILMMFYVSGAGKTYLANQCLQFLGTNLDLHVVSYDNHIEPESDLNIESWKKRRYRVYFKVKELVLNLKSMTTQHIKRKPHVIIIDDNMFLKSMRYSYFQLAREMSVGFCQLHVTTSLDTCLDRIRLRNFSDHSMVKVEDSTIIQMAGKFDVPDGSKNYWEKNSLSVTTDDINYTNLFDFLVSNSRNPVCPNVEKTTKEVRGFDSFSHQADLLMRRLIKVRIDESRKNGLAVDGKKLSDVKKFLMKVFQSQSLETVFNDVLTLPTECQTLLALLEWPVQNWKPEDICEQVVSECFHCCSPP